MQPAQGNPISVPTPTNSEPLSPAKKPQSTKFAAQFLQLKDEFENTQAHLENKKITPDLSTIQKLVKTVKHTVHSILLSLNLTSHIDKKHIDYRKTKELDKEIQKLRYVKHNLTLDALEKANLGTFERFEHTEESVGSLQHIENQLQYIISKHEGSDNVRVREISAYAQKLLKRISEELNTIEPSIKKHTKDYAILAMLEDTALPVGIEKTKEGQVVLVKMRKELIRLGATPSDSAFQERVAAARGKVEEKLFNDPHIARQALDAKVIRNLFKQLNSDNKTLLTAFKNDSDKARAAYEKLAGISQKRPLTFEEITPYLTLSKDNISNATSLQAQDTSKYQAASKFIHTNQTPLKNLFNKAQLSKLTPNIQNSLNLSIDMGNTAVAFHESVNPQFQALLKLRNEAEHYPLDDKGNFKNPIIFPFENHLMNGSVIIYSPIELSKLVSQHKDLVDSLEKLQVESGKRAALYSSIN